LATTHSFIWNLGYETCFKWIFLITRMFIIWIYLCGWSGDSTKENAMSMKWVKSIMWHWWKLRPYQCNLCRRCDENVVTKLKNIVCVIIVSILAPIKIWHLFSEMNNLHPKYMPPWGLASLFWSCKKPYCLTTFNLQWDINFLVLLYLNVLSL
jgi:hypothetical protein